MYVNRMDAWGGGSQPRGTWGGDEARTEDEGREGSTSKGNVAWSGSEGTFSWAPSQERKRGVERVREGERYATLIAAESKSDRIG